jgi:hypothetical protein
MNTIYDKYVMPLLEEFFYFIGITKVFSTLDLQFRYHQLPFLEGDKMKIIFWGVDQNGKELFVLVEILTFWVEECTCRMLKGNGLGSYKLGFC